MAGLIRAGPSASFASFALPLVLLAPAVAIGSDPAETPLVPTGDQPSTPQSFARGTHE